MKPQSPFADALALWHMNGKTDPAIEVHGKVNLGVALPPKDAAASRKRGGDGRAARFDGGWLRVADSSLALTGGEMTLCVRLLLKSAADWNAPILSRDMPADEYNRVLFGRNDAIHYVWQTTPAPERINNPPGLGKDFTDGIMVVDAPHRVVGDGWHDLIARFRGPNIELFVDGVLIDEEWPHGDLHNFAGPLLIGAAYGNGQLLSGFHGLIDHVALWNRALTDDEITTLSGGPVEVKRRDLQYLGPNAKSPLYWRPRGWNAFAGDAMMHTHNGRLILYYLFDRRQHLSSWRLGKHQYAAWSTTDLKNWTYHGLVLPITHGWECALGTGDFLTHNGTCYLAYPDCGDRCEFKDKPHRGAGVFMVTSPDAIHFDKTPAPAFTPGFDPALFREESSGLFHILTGGNIDGKNGLVDFVSADFKNWKRLDKFRLEAGGCCPHIFQWNDWYYIFMDCKIWRSKSYDGPWTQQPDPTLTIIFPKTTPLGDRRFAAGWIGDHGWGGDLVMCELIQHADGSIGSKFVPEMIPPTSAALKLDITDLRGGASKKGRDIHLAPTNEPAIAALDNVPHDVRITATIRHAPAAASFGITIHGAGDYASGCEIRVEPAQNRVQIGYNRNGFLAPPAHQTFWQHDNYPLNNVDGLDQPITLDIVARRDLVDVCIDNRRTMVARRADKGSRLFLFAAGGSVTFENVLVRPLKNV